MPEKTIKVGLCRMHQHDQCQVICYLDEHGELVKTEYPSDASSHHRPWYKTVDSCERQKNVRDYIYHPQRLKYPLKRSGERGQNKWETITWDQALDEIADKLKTIRDKYGAEALGIPFGFYNEQWDVARFANLFGTPNIDSINARICGATEAWINIITYGGIAHYGDTIDRNLTKLVVLWANRPMWTNPIKWKEEKEVPHRIVIDPCWIDECKGADYWLSPRPGTDVALALGWLNVIINEGLYDKDFVERWTYGFEDLVERVKRYPPEKVEEITGIPKKDVVESARLYATIKPAYIAWGSPTGYQGHNTDEVERARCILRAITGNLDVKGGNMITPVFSKQIKLAELELAEELPREQVVKALGSDKYKLLTWPGYELFIKDVVFEGRRSLARGAPAHMIFHAARTGQPYPIKAIITLAANSVVTMPHCNHIIEAIKNVELFVVLEAWGMTPTTLFGDYVLPMTDWLERPQWSFLDYRNQVITGERVLPKSKPGEYDRWDEYDFFRGLALRLGQPKELWRWECLEEVYNDKAAKMGMNWDELSGFKRWVEEPLVEKKYEKEGKFRTRTGKVEIRSTMYEALGYDPLPVFHEMPESHVSTPELAKEYPYYLVARKPRRFCHSRMRQIESIRKLAPDPTVLVNPDTAKKHGIGDGDWIWIETRIGRFKQKCTYHQIRSDTICAEFGWWYPEKMTGENPDMDQVLEPAINRAIPDDPDYAGKCGNWFLAPPLCKIYKAT